MKKIGSKQKKVLVESINDLSDLSEIENEILDEDIETDVLESGYCEEDEPFEKPEIIDASSIEEISEDSGVKDIRTKAISDILFKLPLVDCPIVGTPKEVQEKLDELVLKIQKHKNSKYNDMYFNRIHVYMHGWLLNVVLKQFPYIKGYQTADIYQESLIALRFKAIPGFKAGKGMSFLNFAKMCIRRWLITLLNSSQNRLKDKPQNMAFSLDSSPSGEEDGSATFANIIPDGALSVDKQTESLEAILVTKNSLMNELSDFEKVVLSEYLTHSSYKEISKNIAKKTKKNRNSVALTKAVDNALLRIRKKAIMLKAKSKPDDLPLFIER